MSIILLVVYFILVYLFHCYGLGSCYCYFYMPYLVLPLPDCSSRLILLPYSLPLGSYFTFIYLQFIFTVVFTCLPYLFTFLLFVAVGWFWLYLFVAQLFTLVRWFVVPLVYFFIYCRTLPPFALCFYCVAFVYLPTYVTLPTFWLLFTLYYSYVILPYYLPPNLRYCRTFVTLNLPCWFDYTFVALLPFTLLRLLYPHLYLFTTFLRSCCYVVDCVTCCWILVYILFFAYLLLIYLLFIIY